MPLFGLQIRSSPLLAHRHVCLITQSRREVLQALSRHRLSSLRAIRTLFLLRRNSQLTLLTTN